MNESIFKMEIEEKLKKMQKLFAPMEIIEFESEPVLNESNIKPNARITLKWKGRKIPFLMEIKPRTAPKIVREALWQLEKYSEVTNEKLMLLVPYLSKTIIEMLEKTEINGIDLNGNYFIQTDKLLAIRLDRENQYRESATIKNVYAGNSSLVGRLLLRENRFYERVGDIYGEIKRLGGKISLGTVSKVLRVLEEELILEKNSRRIRIIQPQKLLEKLRDNYFPPKIAKSIKLKFPGGRSEIVSILDQILMEHPAPKQSKSNDPLFDSWPGKWVWSGKNSAERYTMTTQAQYFKVYTPSLLNQSDMLCEYEDARFYNCELIQMPDTIAYFDSDGHWVSKLQCYLELCQLDKREKEIAKDIAQDILNAFDVAPKPFKRRKK